MSTAIKPWPHVTPSRTGFDAPFKEYLDLTWNQKKEFIARLRNTAPQEAEAVLQRFLGVIASYLYGYADSPIEGRVDRELEMRLLQAKLALEQELLDELAPAVGEVPDVGNQKKTADFLEEFVTANPGYNHPLFEYLERRAGRREILTFVLNEIVRNEIFDDEVALLTVGLQGTLKATAAENLYDEVGRGHLKHFHTAWLQRLLDAEQAWNALAAYRNKRERWGMHWTFATMNAFLTRPGLKYAAYGATTTYESWVPHHFTRLLGGMRRVGITQPDSKLYFQAHVRIDKHHGRELIRAIGAQTPELTVENCRQITVGALTAVNAACRQYDYTLQYLQKLGHSYNYPL